MHLLGCLFTLLFIAVFIGLAFVGTIIRVILSILGINNTVSRKKTERYEWQEMDEHHDNGYEDQQQQQQNRSQTNQSAGRQTQKIFEKDDSEYVDYEEVR